MKGWEHHKKSAQSGKNVTTVHSGNDVAHMARKTLWQEQGDVGSVAVGRPGIPPGETAVAMYEASCHGDEPCRAWLRSLEFQQKNTQVTFESTHSCRHTSTISHDLAQRLEGLSPGVQAIAWKAQIRLHKKYVQVVSRGKSYSVALVAVTREFLSFVWATAQQVNREVADGRRAAKTIILHTEAIRRNLCDLRAT